MIHSRSPTTSFVRCWASSSISIIQEGKGEYQPSMPNWSISKSLFSVCSNDGLWYLFLIGGVGGSPSLHPQPSRVTQLPAISTPSKLQRSYFSKRKKHSWSDRKKMSKSPVPHHDHASSAPLPPPTSITTTATWWWWHDLNYFRPLYFFLTRSRRPVPPYIIQSSWRRGFPTPSPASRTRCNLEQWITSIPTW